MARIIDLLAVNQESNQSEGLDSVPWYGIVVAPVPVADTDPLYVQIPDLSQDQKFDCRWNNAQIPGEGKECLVVMDNRWNLWVPVIWG